MKILVIQKKKIGDVLTSTVIFEQLKETFPTSELHYLIDSNAIPVVKNNPNIDDLILTNKKTFANKIEFLKFIFKIKKEKYDVVIDSYCTFSSIIIGWLSGAKKTISFEKSYSKIFYTDTVKRNKKSFSVATKAVEHRLILLEPLNIKFKPLKPKIFLTEDEKETAKNGLINAGIDVTKPVIMISAVGSESDKTYPFHYMAQLIETISSNSEVQFLFNYLPHQENQARKIYNLCDALTQDKIYFNYYKNELRDFITLTSQCCALIGNEGGATNMAKAINIPTFTIFSPKILKNDWNMFENQTTNISVHPDDFIKSRKGNTLNEKYELFSPELFQDKLIAFLNYNVK